MISLTNQLLYESDKNQRNVYTYQFIELEGFFGWKGLIVLCLNLHQSSTFISIDCDLGPIDLEQLNTIRVPDNVKAWTFLSVLTITSSINN